MSTLPTLSIGVIASETKAARQALSRLAKLYDFTRIDAEKPEKAKVDVVLALGGDGFMLHTLHEFINSGIPIYGMNCGTVGFLMNTYQEKKLLERIAAARPTMIHPLLMKVLTREDKVIERRAINEVSLMRQTAQAAHIQISIDGIVQMKELVGDGVLVSTPAGSSAYNASLGGPIMPLRTEIVSLTPISPFRPRRWGGAILPDRARVGFQVIDPKKRPVTAVADFVATKNVVSVEVMKDKSQSVTLLFDPGHSLEERILKEQFQS
ncbi:MAG: NAD kinase [Proteobacteria bacterium]|nr:NAD kinase [Pseudomonadota bacterium]